MHIGKISSGISDLDRLIDSLYVGDNVVWEIESGTVFDIFKYHFIKQSTEEKQNVIYVSFNKSPHSILQQLNGIISKNNFILIDCFTSGKGKNDKAFIKFYENPTEINVIRVENPKDINNFTKVLNNMEDNLPSGTRYIFDSLTGMQDLWGDENTTYKFFTYLCPLLYDLGTVAYWILEKEAHSQTFKANLRHVTQVVLELYRRKDKLFIKALKLEGRSGREAFKPHQYEVDSQKRVYIASAKRDFFVDIGTKIKDIRTKMGINQKELAEKVDLTPSFISQLENNQISPSLNSFLQICDALGVTPSVILGDKNEQSEWIIRRERIFSFPVIEEEEIKVFPIINNADINAYTIVFEPFMKSEKKIKQERGKRLIYVLKGNVTVLLNGRHEKLKQGDMLCLKDDVSSLWKNEGGDRIELLLVCL